VPTARANGIDIEFVTEGDPAHPTLLLVMGLGGQLTAWAEGFVDGLCDRGFFVIRFDNRDSGRSTKFAGLPDLTSIVTAWFRGEPRPAAPYLIEDMADDAAALLTELGIQEAHVVGVSMGGMIAQALAIHHPVRFLSACSIMSTTGDWSTGMPTGEALTALLRPVAHSREEAIEASLAGSRAIGSPAYPTDEAVLRARAAAAYDRGYCPEGTARQIAAILASPDRTEGLHGVRLPFLVIHGERDPLVPLGGGEATAAAVPGSMLLTIPGMGHDLPEPLWGTLTEAIVDNITSASV
jgi:pimeloyl-ACP methyl ester carboxylesterase